MHLSCICHILNVGDWILSLKIMFWEGILPIHSLICSFVLFFIYLFIHLTINIYWALAVKLALLSSGNSVVNKQTQEELKRQFQILLIFTHPFIHVYFQHIVQWIESKKHDFNLHLTAGWSWTSCLNSQSLSFPICCFPWRMTEWITNITYQTAWHFILSHPTSNLTCSPRVRS